MNKLAPILNVRMRSDDFYQTLHLSSCAGFMLDPTGQPQSLEKAAMLENVPWTLNLSGEWAPVRTDNFRAWGLA